MEKEAAIPKREDNVAAVKLMKGASFDLDDIAWPERGQHAFAAHLQAQAPRAAQSFYG
jgi:hypothetical protein